MDENQTLSVKQSTPQKRHVAKIVHIKDIQDGSYVKQEGWEPNFVQTVFNEDIFRVNIIGVVVEPPLSIEGLEQFSCTIDDGTGKIELRAFEEMKIDGNLDIGTPVLVVGKPREYNNVYYILPEIIRPVEKDWIEFRKKELEILDAKRDLVRTSVKPTQQPKVESEPESKENQVETPAAEFSSAHDFDEGEETFDDIDEELDDPTEQTTPQLIELIDSLDKGQGVLVADLEAKVENAEDKVTRLLLHGEVYEIKPGRIKVLK